jgi:magnesium chelatase subunit H
MPKHTSVADSTPIRVVMITLDGHLGAATQRARAALSGELPNLELSLHAATDWKNDPDSLERCRADVARGDIIMPSMLFMEEHIEPILPALAARRDHCDAMVSIMSAGEVMKLTRMGKFSMDGSSRGPLALLKRLRGQRKAGVTKNSGEKQLAMLRRIPQMLRFIPGTAQDVRAYFLTMQYFLASSEDNIRNMVRFLVNRYADGERRTLRGRLDAPAPVEYPEVGLYHPRMPGVISEDLARLPAPKRPQRGRVGLLLMRSYVLSGDAAHYAGVIEALEQRGFQVVPAFAGGLDARPAVDRYFMRDGRCQVDAVVSLTGFSLVGGPAYNDSAAAERMLSDLDVPYVAAHGLEFQSIEQWERCERGLNPVETTMMVALPELDGATGPLVFGGRSVGGDDKGQRQMESHPERSAMLAERVARLVDLRRKQRAERKIGIVVFSFPPQAGAVGTAAYLAVFESLYRTLQTLAEAGYTVRVPESVDALRHAILGDQIGGGDASGAHARVHHRIPVDDHVAREPWLADIEGQWGPAPGRQLTDGRSLFVLGARFGNVLVAVQPGFGYEGDPMRLLFEKGLTPTHAFSAFYRYLREDFRADALLHFGTHGALEFMPGKQSGMSAACWPDRLIGAMPNFYLYAANNPSEGTIAKRRSAATLITYMPPPVAKAGLYRGLQEIKDTLDRWRATPPDRVREREDLAALIRVQAEQLDLLADDAPGWDANPVALIEALRDQVLEFEYTLIPEGLHVLGEPPSRRARIEVLQSMAETVHQVSLPLELIAELVDGVPPAKLMRDWPGYPREVLDSVAANAVALAENHETRAIIHALDGGFIAPAPGGDLLRTPEIMPTGRNMHGFDPFRLPSAFAVREGLRQAQMILDTHTSGGNPLPESIAMVLWGTDNLKNEGVPIAQALALIGARPRFDGYGRLTGAALVPIAELGRPRVDVVLTLSGIFRDLLPLQTRVLAEAAWLASAAADEPLAMNPIRRNTLRYQEKHGCDFETAALRVYGNADGAYGSNVNAMIDQGCWQEEDELADSYTRRKCFAYGRSGRPVAQPELLGSMLADVDLAYQNLESVELGVTTVDHYFDTLGGISRAVNKAKGGESVPVYIGDQTHGEGKVRTLAEQVALETRTRMLNPKWYEGLLAHGYEGVHQIEVSLTNTMGWSATTGQVDPWVYQQVTQTYLLDDAMRQRLAELNPAASAKLANRLIEAHERNYWSPDPDMLEALRRAGDELEDRLEGITEGVAA